MGMFISFLLIAVFASLSAWWFGRGEYRPLVFFEFSCFGVVLLVSAFAAANLWLAWSDTSGEAYNWFMTWATFGAIAAVFAGFVTSPILIYITRTSHAKAAAIFGFGFFIAATATLVVMALFSDYNWF